MQEKHAEAKKKDVARKKAERQKFKDAAENQPRKFKAVLDKIKSATADRVRKFRERQHRKNETIMPTTPATPKLQNQRQHREDIKLLRSQKKIDREANKLRVRNFRLRVQLNTPKDSKKSVSNSPIVDSDNIY